MCSKTKTVHLEDDPKKGLQAKLNRRVSLLSNMAVFHHTLFIAVIALLAPFIPAEIEVPAYIA
jgi:hypothetical protein